MQSLIKLLDKNLEYINHEVEEDIIKIYVKSNREIVLCPCCNNPSSKVHSRYNRNFQDLPILGKKVTIILNNRKMFCKNTNCNKTTFAEMFEFLYPKSKKQKD